jgi:2'-5' RNA ligase
MDPGREKGREVDAAANKAGRLFLAVPLTDEARQRLADSLRGGLRGKALPGRPPRPENWHLTLRFLGDVADDQYRALERRLRQTPLGEPFDLSFDRLGAFPRPARARVLWIGIGRGSEALCSLAETAERTAVAAGFAAEERPYHPHLTVSRLRRPGNLADLIEGFESAPIEMPVVEVVLYRSHLRPEGARYEALERFSLRP